MFILAICRNVVNQKWQIYADNYVEPILLLKIGCRAGTKKIHYIK